MYTHILVLFFDPKDPSLPQYAVRAGVRGQVCDRRYSEFTVICTAKTRQEILRAVAKADDALALQMEEDSALPPISAWRAVDEAIRGVDGITMITRNVDIDVRHSAWKKTRVGRQFRGTHETDRYAWITRAA